MPTLGNHEMRDSSVTPEVIRVCVCVADPDLRTWLVDELTLMTWMGALRLDAFSTLPPASATPDLLIVAFDRLGDVSALRRHATPVLAIGTAPGDIPVDATLSPRLTSRELKQAIRELLVGTR